jgi:DnaJ-class molecular chaperone
MVMMSKQSSDMKPADQAPEGTPSTGETICARCAGTGKLAGKACPDCKGSGTVVEGVGGG